MRSLISPGGLDAVIRWWERGVQLFLCVSVVLIGVGGIETGIPYGDFSAWSISRTTFFFWAIWRVLIWCAGRQVGSSWRDLMPLPLAVFFAAVTISLFPLMRDGGDYRYLFFAVAHCVMIRDLFRDEKSRRFLLLALGLTPGVVLLRGVMANPLILDFSQMERLDYPLDHANTAGHLLAMSIPLAAGLLIALPSRLRYLSSLSVCSQVAALLLTYSRGAWLGLAAAMIFFSVAAGVRKEFFIFAPIMLLLIAFIAPLQQRLVSFSDVRSDPAISARINVMRDTLRIGLTHPVFGIGYGRGRLKSAIRSSTLSETKPNEAIWHAHNTYLELFAGTGLLGLGAFVWLLAAALRKTLSEAREAVGDGKILTLGVAASAVALIVCSLSDVGFYHHETRLYWFTLLALMLRNRQKIARMEANLA